MDSSLKGVLHLVARPGALFDCLARVGDSDAILLIDEGVYALGAGCPGENRGARIHLLLEDLGVRGLSLPVNNPWCVGVNMREFVDLTVEYPRILTWR